MKERNSHLKIIISYRHTEYVLKSINNLNLEKITKLRILKNCRIPINAYFNKEYNFERGRMLFESSYILY